jgi:AcrR family transcriptional regulator
MRAKRSEMMISELETVALGLFETRGFDAVTVEEIASAAQISVRTFYRYFPAKDDVLQVQIDRRSEALRAELAARPTDEPPLQSLRLALAEVVATEDTAHIRRWISVVASTPGVLRGVLGGIQIKAQVVMAEFFADRLGARSDDLVPTMLAAAAGGVIQAAQTKWYFNGGDLAAALSEGLDVLERGVGTDPRAWSHGKRPARATPRSVKRMARPKGA